MLINKIILKVAHFFGCMSDKAHITDVTVNIDCRFYSEKEYELITLSDEKKLPDYLAEDVKKKAYEILKDNTTLEARCRKTSQLWLTFYKDEKEKKSGGSIMKMCYYWDGILYYPYKKDRKKYAEKKNLAFNDEPFLNKK